jgi:hypothetical protein
MKKIKTWYLTLREEHKMIVFEERALRGLSGFKSYVGSKRKLEKIAQ